MFVSSPYAMICGVIVWMKVPGIRTSQGKSPWGKLSPTQGYPSPGQLPTQDRAKWVGGILWYCHHGLAWHKSMEQSAGKQQIVQESLQLCVCVSNLPLPYPTSIQKYQEKTCILGVFHLLDNKHL